MQKAIAKYILLVYTEYAAHSLRNSTPIPREQEIGESHALVETRLK